jgi:acetyl esterase/lipase
MIRMLSSVVFLILTCTTCCAAEPIAIPLWKDGAPGTPATKSADEPTLYLSQPAADSPITKMAVIICPGGSYGHLSMDKEGSQVAQWFNSFGVTAFVLRYRHHGTGHMHPIPMQDGQRAVRTVRSRAAEWNIDPDKIGVMGFSAGGHLASTLCTHFDSGDSAATDPIDRVSSRRDFLILCYPVITMTADYMHKGSRDNLIGANADPELARSMSSELEVTHETPPKFIFQTDADTAVPAENSVAFYLALRKAHVPAELHVDQSGGHGAGFA